MHTHEHMDSRIIFVAGRMVFRKEARAILLNYRHTFRSFRILAKQLHGAVVTGRFGIFINLELWDATPTSAAHDFIRA